MSDRMTRQLGRSKKILDANLESIFLHERDKTNWMETPNRDLNGLPPKDWVARGNPAHVTEVLIKQLGYWIDR